MCNVCLNYLCISLAMGAGVYATRRLNATLAKAVKRNTCLVGGITIAPNVYEVVPA